MSKSKVETVTMTELGERSGVSLPTIQRYKNDGDLDRFLVGSGRTARFKVTAVPVVQKLRDKGVANRGRRG